MNAHNDLDQQLDAYLREGPAELPYQSFDAVRYRMEQTRQRAVIGPWRTPIMNRFLVYGVGAAAIVLAIVVGAQLLSRPSGGVGASSSPEPTPTMTPIPQAGLPEGPFDFALYGASDRAPLIAVNIPTTGWRKIAEVGAIEKGVERDNVPEAAILPFAEPEGTDFYVYGDPCRWQSTKPKKAAQTVDEIVAAIAAQKSRDASDPVSVTVDGYAGKMITLHVPADADFSACEGEFATFGTASEDLARYQQGPGQVDDLWVIDVDGAVVILDAMYRADTAPALVDEMRTIAASAQFRSPNGGSN